MAANPKGVEQIQNIIRRAQALIVNVKLLGADISLAKELLTNSRNALGREEYDSALQFAMQSLKEVMRLKKAVESGKITGIIPAATPPSGSDVTATVPTPPPESAVKKAPKIPSAESIPMAEPIKSTVPGEPGAETTGPSANKPEGTETPASPDQSLIVEESPDGKLFNHEFINGFSYLIEEDRSDKCFIIFQKLVDRDYSGLCITRTNPKLIKKKYSVDQSEMLWLTDRESTVEPTITPSLENMIYVAEEFIDSNDNPILLLDGLEYLISNNTFNSVLRFIRRLLDKISETDAILLIGVSQLAIKEQELKLLEKELSPVII
jgi:hypothetical protein